MIDLTREMPIPLSQVPKLPWLRRLRENMDLSEYDQSDEPLGRIEPATVGENPVLKEHGRRRRLHIATIHRWCTRGLRGRRLEYVQLGGTRVTTEAALQRFFASLTDGREDLPEQPDQQQRQELDRIARQLDAAGL